MIIKCTNEWTERIFSYIGNNYECCLYLYADIKKYGMDSDHVNVWVNVIDGSIRAVVMKYHNGMHIYSKKLDYDRTEVTDFIKSIGPSMILGVSAQISDIVDLLENYSFEYGYVKKYKAEAVDTEYDNIQTATLDDVAALTEMLMLDKELMASYTYDEMFMQLQERISDGYGKTYFIRNEDDICAQAGISADMDRFAIISNVYTANKFRGRHYASSLLNYITRCSCGKKIYLFCYGEKLSQYYDRIGFETVQHWGKIYRKV